MKSSVLSPSEAAASALTHITPALAEWRRTGGVDVTFGAVVEPGPASWRRCCSGRKAVAQLYPDVLDRAWADIELDHVVRELREVSDALGGNAEIRDRLDRVQQLLARHPDPVPRNVPRPTGC